MVRQSAQPSGAPLDPSAPAQRPPALGALALLAGAGAAVTALQAGSVAVTGEELCVGQGCALVGSLTRIPPAWFNLVGCAVFGLVAALALAARRRRAPLLHGALHLCLTAALAAEGVLFAYQWHVAGAWCGYCLGILGLVAAANLCLGVRRAVYGAGAFAATLTIFSLLSFVPMNTGLDGGSYAVRALPEGPELTLVFSENCPHCRNVEAVLGGVERCSVRYNPVVRLSPGALPELAPEAGYDPRVNLALARLLGIETVPILVAREAGGIRILSGEQRILAYLEETCREAPAAEEGGFEPLEFPSILTPDDGCGIRTDCDE